MVTIKLMNKYRFTVGQKIKSVGVCWFERGGHCPPGEPMVVVDIEKIGKRENEESTIYVMYDGQERKVNYGNGFLIPYVGDN